MKRLGIYCLLLFCMVSCQKIEPVVPSSDDDIMFDKLALPKISISVTKAEWNRLLHLFDDDNKTREYVSCEASMTYYSEVSELPNAELRLKGQTSRRRPEAGSGKEHKSGNTDWQHCHFALRSDKGKINLKYAHEDPTYVREMYCWDLAERYGVWTGIKCSYCRLFIHVEGDPQPAYFGVYLMMESIDDMYLAERQDKFGSDKGFLWKCQWGSNLRDTNDWLFKVDDNTSHETAYELKEGKKEFETAKAQLKEFIHMLNTVADTQFEEWLSSVCDVDLLLKTYAMLVAVGHWDDYWNDMNNFYIYFSSRDSQYKFYMIPYDMDNTLGTSHNCGAQHDSGRQDPFNWGLDQCKLMTRIMKVPTFRKKYIEYLEDFTDKGSLLFGWKASQERINSWIALIQDYVPNDTGDDVVIKDKPASWGNHPEYRILTYGENNWFKVKSESLTYWINQ